MINPKQCCFTTTTLLYVLAKNIPENLTYISKGITRHNVYAGLAGLYYVEDRQNPNQFDLPTGDYDIPLVLSERNFDIRDGKAEMVYPYGLCDTNGLPMPPYSMLPEVFGDVMTVNGMAYPVLYVEPRQYRFRVLNVNDARFVRFSIARMPPDVDDVEYLTFRVVMGDQGYIPVVGTETDTTEVRVGPGERYNIVADFSGLDDGTTFFLYNNDTSLIGPVTPMVDDVWMKFIVRSKGSVPASKEYAWNIADPLQTLVDAVKTDNALWYQGLANMTRRQVVVTEVENRNPLGGIRPMPVLASHFPIFSPVQNGWFDPPTEYVTCGLPEIWEIINLSNDHHTIHLHQVMFKILSIEKISEQADFYRSRYGRYRSGNVGKNAVPPAPWDQGPKDIVRLPPHYAVRIVTMFDIEGDFLWHCHVLSHEDDDMMRPIIIRANSTLATCAFPTL